VFPRATAVAEALWSPESYPRGSSSFELNYRSKIHIVVEWNYQRFHSWRCRMNRRGLGVESIAVMYGDGYCNPL
jgi:hypothetical protein